jgi:hypothetical protein
MFERGGLFRIMEILVEHEFQFIAFQYALYMMYESHLHTLSSSLCRVLLVTIISFQQFYM